MLSYLIVEFVTLAVEITPRTLEEGVKITIMKQKAESSDKRKDYIFLYELIPTAFLLNPEWNFNLSTPHI